MDGGQKLPKSKIINKIITNGVKTSVRGDEQKGGFDAFVGVFLSKHLLHLLKSPDVMFASLCYVYSASMHQNLFNTFSEMSKGFTSQMILNNTRSWISSDRQFSSCS